MDHRDAIRSLLQRAARLAAVAVLLGAPPLAAQTSAAQTPAAATPAAAKRVLFVGNSLTYVNDVPRLVQAIAASQPGAAPVDTASFVAPGGSLDERWRDGSAAAALREGRWDALVLQERGGVLVCMASPEHRRERDCRASEAAHRHFAELARSRGVPVLLLATWGPDPGWLPRITRGHEVLADILKRAGADVRIVDAAGALEAEAAGHDRQETFPDGTHPSIAGSLVMAAQLVRAIDGRAPVARDLVIDFPLLPPNARIAADAPLESQPQLAGDGRRLLIRAATLAPLYAAANGD